MHAQCVVQDMPFLEWDRADVTVSADGTTLSLNPEFVQASSCPPAPHTFQMSVGKTTFLHCALQLVPVQVSKLHGTIVLGL